MFVVQLKRIDKFSDFNFILKGDSSKERSKISITAKFFEEILLISGYYGHAKFVDFIYSESGCSITSAA